MFGEKDVVRVAQECFVGKNRREVWRNGSFTEGLLVAKSSRLIAKGIFFIWTLVWSRLSLEAGCL